MNTNVPKIAVVGCGQWGRNLVRNFAELGALGVLCDVDAARLEEMGTRYQVPTSELFEDVLDMREVQAVAIAAPAAQHFALARRAIEAGKDVFVEKPLALHVEEGEQLLALARRHSRVLMVGHLLRYHPAIRQLHQWLHNGDLGKIEYISSSRLNLGRLRTEEDILWSFAPHDVSVILHLLNEMPSQVVAQGASYLNQPISDVTLTVMSFASGVKAHIFVSWLHPFKEQKLVIVGDRKTAVFDDTESERKLVLYPHRIEWVNRLPVAKKAEGEVIPLPKDEPLRDECQHFLDCVRDRRNPKTDGQDGVNVLRVLHAAGQSIRNQGKPQPIREEAAPFYVHPSAIVEEPCEIKSGTKIWHFSHVMKNSSVGSNCILGQNVHVATGVRIGNGVKIQNNVSIYAGVELEDDVFCGPSMVFTNVINPRSHIERKSEYKRTLVKRGATLGANSTIVCGTTVGRYAFVGAGAVVTHDVPDHALVVGVPARQLGWVCACGEKLAKADGTMQCVACGDTHVLRAGVLRRVDPAALPESYLDLGDIPSQASNTRALAGSAGSD